jgi:hypothetical protein
LGADVGQRFSSFFSTFSNFLAPSGGLRYSAIAAGREYYDVPSRPFVHEAVLKASGRV